MITFLNADARHIPLADRSVQCVITSPPYWGLRDYGIPDQIGLERTPAEYVATIVAVMRECWRVLKDDGTLWLNLGDTYASDTKWGGYSTGKHGYIPGVSSNRLRTNTGLKSKDLVGIPWRVAFALQDDGWYLRSDIIWHKPNPLPESVTDRPTKAHEYIFLLTKQERYYYDAEAIMEDCSASTHARISQDLANQVGSYRANGGNKTNGPLKAVVKGSTRKLAEAGSGIKQNRSFEAALALVVDKRNKRTVWTVTTQPYSGAHFSTFPPALIEPMILAGSRTGDVVLDPFAGSGTTGAVAVRHGRKAVLLDLNMTYIDLQFERTSKVQTVMQGMR